MHERVYPNIYICTHTHSYQVCNWVRRYYQDAAFPRSRVRSSAQHGSRIDEEKRVRKRNIETRVRMNYTPMHSNCPCPRALGPARSKPPRVNRDDLSPPPRPPAPPLRWRFERPDPPSGPLPTWWRFQDSMGLLAADLVVRETPGDWKWKFYCLYGETEIIRLWLNSFVCVKLCYRHTDQQPTGRTLRRKGISIAFFLWICGFDSQCCYHNKNSPEKYSF